MGSVLPCQLRKQTPEEATVPLQPGVHRYTPKALVHLSITVAFPPGIYNTSSEIKGLNGNWRKGGDSPPSLLTPRYRGFRER